MNVTTMVPLWISEGLMLYDLEQERSEFVVSIESLLGLQIGRSK